MAFLKLDDRIVFSSIFDEEASVLKVWIACLALANQQRYMEGRFTASIGGLARTTRLTREEVEHAMGVLLGEDPDSTTEKEGGRRLVQEGVNDYVIVTWPEHQGKPETVRKRRNREGEGQVGTTEDNGGQRATTGDTGGKFGSSYSYSSSSLSNKSRSRKKKVEKGVEFTGEFVSFWEASWRRGTKRGSFETWMKMDAGDQIKAMEVVPRWTKAFLMRDAQVRPHVVTWLNNGGWEDEVDAEYGRGKSESEEKSDDKYAKFHGGGA